MAIAFQQLWPRPEPPKKPTNFSNMKTTTTILDRLYEMAIKKGWCVIIDDYYQPKDKVNTLNPPPVTRYTHHYGSVLNSQKSNNTSNMKTIDDAFLERLKAYGQFPGGDIFNEPIRIYKHQQPGFSCMPVIHLKDRFTSLFNLNNMEKTLKLDLKTARELYPQADAAFKKVLEENFGAKALAKDIIERLGDFNDVLAYHGKTAQEFDGETFDLEHDEKCYKALKLIVSAYNEGKVPDWNSNQKKWEPIFNMAHPSGFGFSRTYFTYGYTGTCVGSRLCFLEERCLRDAVKKFESYYRGFYVIEK